MCVCVDGFSLYTLGRERKDGRKEGDCFHSIPSDSIHSVGRLAGQRVIQVIKGWSRIVKVRDVEL